MPPVIAATPPPASITAPATARLGHEVRVVGRHLRAATYSLTIVYDRPPAHNAACLADVGKAKRSQGGRVVLSGVIPRHLACYQGLNVKLGTVPTGTGAYHFVVGKKVGPAGWGDASFVRRAVRITR